jgi:replicative DNA helicase
MQLIFQLKGIHMTTSMKTSVEFLHDAFIRPQFIVVGGRPGSGKSTLGAEILRSAAIDFNKTALMFTLEQSAQEVASSVIALQSGISVSDLATEKLTPEDGEELHKAVEAIAKSNILIDEAREPSLERLRETIAKEKNGSDGLDVVIIDYLQLMSVSKNVSANRKEAVDTILEGLKNIVKEYGVTVILFSQLSREVEKRENKTPELSDLRESKLTYLADSIVLLHRPKMYDDTLAHDESFAIVAKNRSGATGTYPFKAA